MSIAVSEPLIPQHHAANPRLELVAAGQAPVTPGEFADPHPLLPVFFAGAFALLLAGTFVGSIVVWLFLHNSGVIAQ